LFIGLFRKISARRIAANIAELLRKQKGAPTHYTGAE
jgi:hypothetical protein